MLTYKKYKKDHLAIFGDKEKYKNVLKKIGARWNSRMPDGPGWTISRFREKYLVEIIQPQP